MAAEPRNGPDLGKSTRSARKRAGTGGAGARLVAAGLIERDGRLLVGQRRRGDTFALKWEFPGGKARPSETPRQALARELREELGVTAGIGGEVHRTRHRYGEPAPVLLLLFFRADLAGEPRPLAFERIRWVARDQLASLDFLPADRDIVKRLAAGEILRGR